jgi:hypothetical protein
MRKDSDTKNTFEEVDEQIKAFGKQQKTPPAGSTDTPSSDQPQA